MLQLTYVYKHHIRKELWDKMGKNIQKSLLSDGEIYHTHIEYVISKLPRIIKENEL